MGCGVVTTLRMCYGGRMNHPIWGVDTSKWSRRRHLLAWAIYVPFAAAVLFAAKLLADLLAWLP